MKTNSITFRELSNFNDSNSVVLCGVTLNAESADEQKLLNEILSDNGLSKGKNVIGIHHIEGNVRGEEGRTDWLVEFDNENIDFNPMARLMMGDTVKWTSDFITNFAKDYKR